VPNWRMRRVVQNATFVSFRVGRTRSSPGVRARPGPDLSQLERGAQPAWLRRPEGPSPPFTDFRYTVR